MFLCQLTDGMIVRYYISAQQNHQNEGQLWHRVTLVDDHVSELRQEARRPRKHTQQVHLFSETEHVVGPLQDGRTPRHSRAQSLFHSYDHRALNRSEVKMATV